MNYSPDGYETAPLLLIGASGFQSPGGFGANMASYYPEFDCETIKIALMTNKNDQLARESLLGYSTMPAPGAQIASSNIVFDALSSTPVGTYDLRMRYFSSITETAIDESGFFRFIFTSPGEFTVEDHYQKTWVVTADNGEGTGLPPPGLAINIFDPNYAIRIGSTATPIPCMVFLKDKFFDESVTACAIVPPEPPPPPQLTKLPKFANFSQFVNPFGFQKGN